MKMVLAVRMFLLLAAIAVCSPAHAKRVALVIGNSAYEHVPVLANPGNDASDIAAKLESLGFEVVTGKDLSLDAMRRTVRDFIKTLDGAELSLFFYAGHGLQVNGTNYMAPIDAKLGSYDDLEFEAMPVDLIVSAMERNTKTNLVFLDACRDNPLAENLARSMGTRSSAVGRGLARIGSGVGTLVSFATQPGNVALDGNGRNSPFSSALAKHLGTPGQDITRDLILVRRDVLEATGGKQVPWDNSSLTGEVVLKPAEKAEPKEEAKQETKPVEAKPDNSVELAFWQSVKDSTDPRLLEAYVEQFPQGAFANLARVKIELIKAAVDKEAQAKAAAEKLENEKAEADAKAAEEAARKAVEAQKAAVEAEAARKAEAQKAATQDAAKQAARQKELEAEAQKAAELAKLREKEAETAYWTSIQSAGGTASFEAYLAKYPQGQFTDLARIRIDEIARTAAARAEAAKAEAEKQKQLQVASLQQPVTAKETETRSLAPEELARETQRELQRLGCLIGSVDGNWGNGSRRALENYAGRQGLKLASLDPALDTLDRLKATTVRVCPLVCGKGLEEKAGRCVAVKKAEPVKKQASVEKKEQAKPEKKVVSESASKAKSLPGVESRSAPKINKADFVCAMCEGSAGTNRYRKLCARRGTAEANFPSNSCTIITN